MFGALRQGSPIYIFTKGETNRMEVGQVESFSEPKPKFQSQFNYLQPTEKVIEVMKVRIGDELVEFNSLPTDSSKTSYKNNTVVVSDSLDAVLSEVENLKRAHEAEISKMPYYEKSVESCDAILKEYNQAYARAEQQEKRISGIENRIGGIEESVGSINGKLDFILKSLDNKK